MSRTARALGALLLTGTLALTACSGGELVAQSDGQSAGVVTPNLDAARIDSVLTDVSEALAAGDGAKDAALLEGRVGGAALRMRGDQYTVAKATDSAVPTLDLSAQVLTVTNADTWPRTILDITAADSGQLPYVHWFVQEDARAPYKLVNWTRLLGGTSLTTYSAEAGSPALAPDATGFVATPADALTSYVDMLNSGTAGSDLFTADEFTNTYLNDVASLAQSVEAAGTVTAHADVVPDVPVTAVTLQDGSALVAGAFTYTHTYQRTIARSKMTLGGTAAAVNEGDDAVIGTITVTHFATVLIQLPPAGSGAKAAVVGAQRVIESTSRDDNAKPEGE